MATVNTHHDNTLLLHAKSWKQRVGLGVVAWVALGVATALLDPRHDGAGVIGLCGGFGAWLATGAGLAAAYTVSQAAYRRSGAIASVVAGVLSLAVVGVLLAAIDWNAALLGVMTVLFAGIVAMLNVGDSHRSEFQEVPTDSYDHPYTDLDGAWRHEDEAALRELWRD